MKKDPFKTERSKLYVMNFVSFNIQDSSVDDIGKSYSKGSIALSQVGKKLSGVITHLSYHVKIVAPLLSSAFFS